MYSLHARPAPPGPDDVDADPRRFGYGVLTLAPVANDGLTWTAGDGCGTATAAVAGALVDFAARLNDGDATAERADELFVALNNLQTRYVEFRPLSRDEAGPVAANIGVCGCDWTTGRLRHNLTDAETDGRAHIRAAVDTVESARNNLATPRLKGQPNADAAARLRRVAGRMFDAMPDADVSAVAAVTVGTTGEAARATPPTAAETDPNSSMPPDLNDAEQAIVDALRETGHRMTAPKLARKALGKENDGHVKMVLSGMIKRKLLTNEAKAQPRGYGLPGWPA